MIKESKWKDKIHAYALKNAIEHEGKAQEGSVISSLFHEGLKKEHVREVISDIKKIVSEVNKLGIEAQKKEYEDFKEDVSERHEREGLPELENSDNGVIMRFSPSASGIMHLGHIITGMPTSLYVKKYGGKFYLRIEDTNPEKSDLEAYNSFPEDCKWIFGNVSEWYAQSDRMEKYYNFAEDLIKKGVAFVCTCKKQEDEEDPTPRKICDCRKNSIKDNQERWKKMLDKKGFKEGEAVLRFKSPNINLSNPALIDFPLARINEHKHPRQGNKYRVWPLMNLCVTLDDMEFKITHIVRAKEHADSAKRQAMIFEIYKKKLPIAYFLGRYKFEDMPLSKSKFQEMIKAGKYSGWDDIRLPLARNFRRRGYQPEAFANLAIKRGISEVDKVISQNDFFTELNNFNREILHEIAIKASFEEQKKKSKESIEVLMPDAKVSYGKSDLDLKKIKDIQIVHFIGLGYCKYNKDEKVKFWFAHK